MYQKRSECRGIEELYHWSRSQQTSHHHGMVSTVQYMPYVLTLHFFFPRFFRLFTIFSFRPSLLLFLILNLLQLLLRPLLSLLLQYIFPPTLPPHLPLFLLLLYRILLSSTILHPLIDDIITMILYRTWRDKFWSVNKSVLEDISPRYMGVSTVDTVVFTVTNLPSSNSTGYISGISCVSVQVHPQKPGENSVNYLI